MQTRDWRAYWLEVGDRISAAMEHVDVTMCMSLEEVADTARHILANDREAVALLEGLQEGIEDARNALELLEMAERELFDAMPAAM